MGKKRCGFIESVFLSVAGLAAYNCVIQFFVYPSFNNVLGAEKFGDLLTLFAVMSVFAVSVGSGANFSRLASGARLKASNGDYNFFLLLCGGLIAAASVVTLSVFGGQRALSFLFYPLGGIIIMLRVYSDCEFKLKLSYRRLFIYYLILSAATFAGVVFFKLTSYWETVFIVGELPAVLYVVFCGDIYRRPLLKPSENRRPVLVSCARLAVSQSFSNFIVNSDRVLVRAFLSGSEVTVFYTSSLLGKSMALLTGPIEGVIIGYLARYGKPVTKRFFAACVAVSLAVGALVFLFFIPAAPFVIGLLYPDVIDDARRHLLAANGGQIVFFISNLLLVVILRFASEKYQLLVNGLYITTYFIVCVPILLRRGLGGFITAVLALNILRLTAVVIIGFNKAHGGTTERIKNIK